jgi:hypothetical protein
MATAPSFWAAAGSKIKSADSPNPKITEAPPKSKPDPQQRKGLVLKGMANGQPTNGASNSTYSKSATAANGKKADWAEDDDDKDFIAEFMSQDPKIATLETTVALKDERVKELDVVVVTKTLRIAELEGEVQDKDYHIDDLEQEIKEKDKEIEALKKENSDQFLHNQELLREADGKDSRIEKLEDELDKKATAIRDLEQDSASLVPVPTKDKVTTEDDPSNKVSESTKTDGTDVVTEAETEVENAASETSGLDSFEIVNPPTTVEVKDEKTDATAVEQSKETETATKALRPSFGASDFPTFVTKETLKVVPPAPKPKTLTFPMDMSKYGKKPTISSATHMMRPSPPVAADKIGHNTPWGHSSKQARDKAGTMPEFNPSADVRHMPHGERVVYGNGPEVIVKLGDVKLATIPKYILMQCSSRALKYFTANPDATSWVLPAGSMDADAATAHLNWMDEMTYQSRVYSVRLLTDPVYDTKNLQICRAARVLGLNNTYVAQFTKQFCDRIRAQDVSFEFMDLVCQLAYPENDPIFDCLGNNLVNQKKVGNAKAVADLEKLLAKHVLLKAKIEKIEKRIGGRPRKTWKSPEGSVRDGSNDRSCDVGGKGSTSGQLGPSNDVATPARGEGLFTTLH